VVIFNLDLGVWKWMERDNSTQGLCSLQQSLIIHVDCISSVCKFPAKLSESDWWCQKLHPANSLPVLRKKFPPWTKSAWLSKASFILLY